MWGDVRRALNDLDWDDTTPTGDLLQEWTGTVSALMTVRQALQPPLSSTDPFTDLAIATRGANRAALDGPPIPSPELSGVRAALAGVLDGHDEAQHLHLLTHAAYRLAHWTRVRAGEHPVAAWLEAAEYALDAALHAPAVPSATTAALGRWRDALADVQRDPDPHRRGVVRAHNAMLVAAHHDVGAALASGLLPPDYAGDLQAGIRRLSKAYQGMESRLQHAPVDVSPASQALMRRLAAARSQVVARPSGETLTGRVDALLRSDLAHAGIAAALAGAPEARRAAEHLQSLTLAYLNHPAVLTARGRPQAQQGAVLPPDNQGHALPGQQAATRSPAHTIRPGTVLDHADVIELCRRRDLGQAASVADPANPPSALQGIDPATWPRLVDAGRQSVADLVASVIPMAQSMVRGSYQADDRRGDLFLALMRAAHAYQPTGASWPHYVWNTLEHQTWLGVDSAGITQRRGTSGPALSYLAGDDPSSPAPGPEDVAVARINLDAIQASVDALPPYLREPLQRRMDGDTLRTIATALQISTATAGRRVEAARQRVRDDLDALDVEPSTPAPPPLSSSTSPAQAPKGLAAPPIWERAVSPAPPPAAMPVIASTRLPTLHP